MLANAHFGLVVSNLERSLAFYHGILEMEIIGVMERKGEDISRIVGLPEVHLKAAFLKFPGPHGPALELIEYLSPRGHLVDTLPCNPGNAHIAFLAEDVHAVHAAWTARGVRFKGDPVAIETGMNRGGWTIYFQDPDGISLELFQPPPPGSSGPPAIADAEER